MPERVKAHLALLGVNLLYAGGFSLVKIILPSLIQANGFILLRVWAAAFLFSITFLFGKQFNQRIEKQDYKRLILCALFGVAGNQLLFFHGLKLTTPIHGALMMLTTPILVALFSIFLLKEKTGWKLYLGLLLGIAGAALLMLNAQKSALGSNPILGDVFVFLNAVFFAISLVKVKPLMKKYRPLVVIRAMFLIGAIMVFPFGMKEVLQISWEQFSPNDYAILIYVLIGMTFLTYLWNMYAVKILSPTVVGTYIYLQPILASFIAIVFFHEAINAIKILSAILIFFGVWLVSKRSM